MIDIAKWAKYAEEHFSISDESIEYSMEHTMQQMLTWQRYDPDEKRTHPPKQGEYLVLINGEIVINAMFEKGTYQRKGLKKVGFGSEKVAEVSE